MDKIRGKIDDARKGNTCRSFVKTQEYEQAYDTIDRGERDVPLDQIVGSVGRYNDFDNKFKLKQHIPHARLARIKQAMRNGTPLPAVKLYQIKDEYYVLDGNHRISAAKEARYDTIRARIVEFIPGRSTLDNILVRERAEFHQKTRLSEEIKLTEVGQYDHLMAQIEKHRKYLEDQRGKSISLRNTARDWYATIYVPLVGIIKKSRLNNAFPDRTAGDLYAYISHHQWARKQGRERRYKGLNMDDLIPGTMEEFREQSKNRKAFDYPEMHRKITVFILMKVQGQQDYKIIDRLYAMDEVREAHSVHGETDILAKVVLKRDLLRSDAETIGEFVHRKLRRINGVSGTSTLIPGYSKVKNTKGRKDQSYLPDL